MKITKYRYAIISPLHCHIALPDKFTYPFHYTPHPYVMAADEVQVYLQHQAQWQDELQQGKMFGVLDCKNRGRNRLSGCFLRHSGRKKNIHPYFVPPIYDLLQRTDSSRKRRRRTYLPPSTTAYVSWKRIPLIRNAGKHWKKETARCSRLLSSQKPNWRLPKNCATAVRRNNWVNPNRLPRSEKASFKRPNWNVWNVVWKNTYPPLQKETDNGVSQIEALKNERKSRSATLQQQLFEQFRLLNARGEWKICCSIFAHTVHKIPPAGAGRMPP